MKLGGHDAVPCEPSVVQSGTSDTHSWMTLAIFTRTYPHAIHRRCVAFGRCPRPWPHPDRVLPLVATVVTREVSRVDEVYPESVEPIRRRVAYMHGPWRVTYLRCTESGRQTDIQHGLIAGPLVSDPSTATIWVAVMPDGSTQHIMIRRNAITNITSPGHTSAAPARLNQTAT